ncbi:peptidase M29, aminopeptidase II [Staphylothermus marinus F1]|uniref:Peptidase M29, aminopeptidase II n=1 Tax=Staphylothermus marinus (strain ATCC 43588 / DSM 3639 / JCM 9404 / F1) TaxID=399550 RepID=A3DLJ5_STAMF|nr:aminopeptidase [Staphylothermus marinus]ABN69505.1 peptidase M29, aminopeptidase II [Staphylothermus marinus F1]
MVDPRVSNLARLLVEYCIEAGKGDEVVVNAGVEAIPLVREVVKYLVSRGSYPVMINLSDESISEVFYRYATKDVLEHISSIEKYVLENIDASISIISPSHTKPFIGIDPEKMKIRSGARRELTKIFMERSARRELRWTVTAYPTKALAQEAGMSIIDYEDFVFHATYADTDDPVKKWVEIKEKQQRIADFLNNVSELKYEGPGIDLVLRVEGRKWINDDGKYNMPGGEVFSAPIEDSVEGYVEFDYPAIWRGVEVEGVKLVFKKGVVVEAHARRGEEFLKKMLETDEGAKRLGEIAFGLNYNITRFTKEILFDEKIGGTIHMALGAAYPETGGKNVSAIHWDMIKDMRKHRIYADGDLIYENGYFIKDVLEV